MSDLLCVPFRTGWQVGISERRTLCRPGGAHQPSPVSRALSTYGTLKTRPHGRWLPPLAEVPGGLAGHEEPPQAIHDPLGRLGS